MRGEALPLGEQPPQTVPRGLRDLIVFERQRIQNVRPTSLPQSVKFAAPMKDVRVGHVLEIEAEDVLPESARHLGPKYPRTGHDTVRLVRDEAVGPNEPIPEEDLFLLGVERRTDDHAVAVKHVKALHAVVRFKARVAIAVVRSRGEIAGQVGKVEDGGGDFDGTRGIAVLPGFVVVTESAEGGGRRRLFLSSDGRFGRAVEADRSRYSGTRRVAARVDPGVDLSRKRGCCGDRRCDGGGCLGGEGHDEDCPSFKKLRRPLCSRQYCVFTLLFLLLSRALLQVARVVVAASGRFAIVYRAQKCVSLKSYVRLPNFFRGDLVNFVEMPRGGCAVAPKGHEIRPC
mmetsp:Transcript_44702/g.136378  ORF Transcript_44702/g.136378 Transcript_44702/m.136378 type:complete len:343 (-) Transcript_44702:20-1048(-)